MVVVELAGFASVTFSTATNLTDVQVGQRFVVMNVGVISAEVLDSAIVEVGPEIVIGGQVGQGLYTVSVEPCPGMVTGGQVGQGLYTVDVEDFPEIVNVGQVGQGL